VCYNVLQAASGLHIVPSSTVAATVPWLLLQEDDVMQLLQMDADEDSQHTAALLSRSASAAAAPASRAGSLGISPGHSDVQASHSLRAQAAAGASKQAAAGAAAAGAAGGAAGGFSFQMFGKDLTNSSKPQQVSVPLVGVAGVVRYDVFCCTASSMCCT
jgi:hypothetical protein